jgi:hypothetical protein
MKRLVFLTALLPITAFAQGINSPNLSTDQQAQGQLQGQGQEQAQGQAQGQLQGQAQGNFNAVDVDNRVSSASLSNADSRSTSGALAGSLSLAGSAAEQSQSVSVAEGAVQNSTATTTSTSQTQASTATNAGNSQTITYQEATDKTVRHVGTSEVRTVPTAIAPNVYPTASCAMSATVGASALGWGVSGGGTKVNEECMQLEAARMFSQLGFTSQGLALACSTKSALAVFGDRNACIQHAASAAPATPAAPVAVTTAEPVKTEPSGPFGEVK